MKELAILPPITAEMVAAHRGAPAPLREWATTFAELLRDSAHTPLYDGEWHLGAVGGLGRPFELADTLVQQIISQKACGYVQWDFGDAIYPITLRDMSSADAGRVKAWRKLVSAGSAPPTLLQWISGLAAYVVLDGHDRLLAAAIERVPAPVLALEAVRDILPSDERKRNAMESVEKALNAAQRARATDERLARARRLFETEDANRLLLDGFLSWETSAASSAQPIRGGTDQWDREVRAVLAARSIRETSLLDG